MPAASATHYSAATSETTCLHQDGPHAPGPVGKHSADLETGSLHRSARDASARAAPGLQTLVEVQVQGSFSQTKDRPGDRDLDQGDGKGQPILGSREDPRRIAQAGHSRVQANHSEGPEAGPCHQATRTAVGDLSA